MHRSHTLLALACCILQVSVVTVAQEEWPRVAKGNAELAEATKTGIADGNWSPALTGERRPLYRVCKSDVLQIGFTFVPEFNQTVTVQPDGFIPLRGMDTLYAEGRTVPELREAIQSEYSAIMMDPELTIVLTEFDRPHFTAAGEVSHPGRYELRSDTTVTEAVAMAGGFTVQARHSQVVLFRRASGDLVETQLLDIKQMLKSRRLSEDVHLKPGDVLFVPQSTISKLARYLHIANLSTYWNPNQF